MPTVASASAAPFCNLVIVQIQVVQPFAVGTADINSIDRIAAAIRKEIVALQTCIGVIHNIRIEESADFGIIISGQQIIEPGLCGAGAAKLEHSYMTHTPQRGIS